MTDSRPPFPPFTLDTAIQKVRMAEDSWNTCNPEKVSLGYAPDSRWTENRIAVRFAYEWHYDSVNWFRSYGNENWHYNAAGLFEGKLN